MFESKERRRGENTRRGWIVVSVFDIRSSTKVSKRLYTFYREYIVRDILKFIGAVVIIIR